MELIVEGIPIIMTVSPATDDDDPRLIATIKDSEVVYSCSLAPRLSKHLYVKNSIYESLRKIIASKDTHLMSAKFTNNRYDTLKVDTFYYFESAPREFTRDCPLEKQVSYQQIRSAIVKYKNAERAASNHKLLERIENLMTCMEKLTERVAALEAQISEK